MSNQNTALMTQDDFMLPDMTASMDFTTDDLADDMEGIEIKLPRIKIPSGGTIQFELPTDDPENPDYTKTLEGIILYHHPQFAYWPEGKEYDESTAPLCSSVDGKTGIGEPGGNCSMCALNEYGTAAEGRGKACKNMRTLYLLCSGQFLPYQLSLSPTSLKPFTDFCNQAFAFRRRACFGSVVQISLKKMTNGTNEYSVAVFKRILDFDGEKLAQVRAYTENFREQIKYSLQQRAVTYESRYEDICEYGPDTPGALPNMDYAGNIYAGQVLNGEYEELPA